MPSTLQLQLQSDKKIVSTKNDKDDEGFQNLLEDRERFVDASTRKSRDLDKEAFLSRGVYSSTFFVVLLIKDIAPRKKRKYREKEKKKRENEKEEEESFLGIVQHLPPSLTLILPYLTSFARIRQAYYICYTFQGETKEKIENEKKEKEEEEEEEGEGEEEEEEEEEEGEGEEEEEEEEEEARRRRSKPVQFQNGIEWVV
ncbi:hypothetical protein V1478_012714 [Vespula squamosa]|uniref:Uncharacterized protein n=1 Tax=Vespula squamosa TaxID=30214 RepID=A0ABD2A8Q7_VESSQ